LIGNGGGNGGSIECRNVPIDGRGIAGGKAIETAAVGAAVMVVLGRLLNCQLDPSRKMSKKHVKMGDFVRADSTPAANATPRHQYIARERMP
jgi:hypothetical protein